MTIDTEFLSENNITKEEYLEYYNNATLPETQKEVNEYGKVTITVGNSAFEFHKGDSDEEEIVNQLQEEYRKNTTDIHFLKLTKKKKQEEIDKYTLTTEEEWRNEMQANLEYIACMQELSQF